MVIKMKAKYLSVSQLNARVKMALEQEVGTVFVSGELASATRSALGHWYFTLKDQAAQVSCVCFSGRSIGLKEPLKVGMQVKVHATVGLYVPRGQFQLTVWAIELDGDGKLQADFLKLKAELREQGLFDSAAKKPLPFIPNQIGVITSPTGAAIADILKVLRHRFPMVPVVIYPCLVQGELASEQIVKAITIAGQRSECDVLIVSRGGGDLSDLMAFNTKQVAIAIYNCHLPIVTGIGHETDETIADYVADVRAATPSVAASTVCPDQYELQQLLGERLERISSQINQYLSTCSQRVKMCSQCLISPLEALEIINSRLLTKVEQLCRMQERRLMLSKQEVSSLQQRLNQYTPLFQIQQHSFQIDQLTRSLVNSIQQSLLRSESALKETHTHIESLSPQKTLSRGYAIVTTEQGELLTQTNQASLGQDIKVCLSQFELTASIKRVFDHKRLS